MPQATQEGHFTLPIASLQLQDQPAITQLQLTSWQQPVQCQLAATTTPWLYTQRRRELGVPKHTHKHPKEAKEQQVQINSRNHL